MATDLYTNAFADNLRLAKSKLILSPADDTYNVIKIPKFAFVKDVWLEVVSATDVAPDACNVGWMGNGETAVTNGFITVDVADPVATGLKRAMKDTGVTFTGKYFSTAAGAITFTFTAGAAATKGSYRIFVDYIIIH